METKHASRGPTATSNDNRLLTIDEAAIQLRISPRTCWRLLAMGKLRRVKLCRGVRIPITSVEDLIEKGGTI